MTPGIWTKLFRRAEARTHEQQIRENASEQRAILREIDRLRNHIRDLRKQGEVAEGACSAAANALQERQEIWTSKKTELEDLRREFDGIKPLMNAAELETVEVQKAGLWHDRELAALRTKLFGAAFPCMKRGLPKWEEAAAVFGAIFTLSLSCCRIGSLTARIMFR